MFLDTTMAVGSTNESVVVTAETPLIDTTAAISGVVVSAESIDAIPSFNNSAIPLVALSPGLAFGTPNQNPLHLWSNTGLSAITADESGSGTNAVNYKIDGGSDTIGAGNVAYVPPMDAVSEFRVTKNAYDASISRTAAGTIETVIKSGGKDFHGVLYEQNQNNTLNANYTQNKGGLIPVPPQHTNEYGGNIGGPIWIPKIFNGRNQHTFFFFNYDGLRSKNIGNQGNMNLPTALERTGDFSTSYVGQTSGGTTTPIQVTLYDPLTINKTTGNRTQFANNILPSNRISPVAKAIYALMPLPERAGDANGSDSNNYVRNEININKFSNYLVRVDNALNDAHHTFAEFRYNNLWQISGDPFGADNALDSQTLIRTNYGMALDHAWVVKPTFLLNFHGNATFYRTQNVSLCVGWDPTQYGFSSALKALQVFPSIPQIVNVGSGYEQGGYGAGEGPKYTNDVIYEGAAAATYIIGNHSIKYGLEYMVQQEATGDKGTGAGNFTFNNNWTTQNPNTGSTSSTGQNAGTGVGSNIADFDLGMPTSGGLPVNATAFWSQPFIGFFGQDDWRVTSRLTLNVGLRWDYQEALTERHDKFWSIFNPTKPITAVNNYAQPLYAASIAGASTNTGVQLLQGYGAAGTAFSAKGAIEYANINGNPRAVTGSTKKYFQPRIGFAFQLRPNTVLRGGLGRFVQANFVPGHASQLGYSQTTNFNATTDNYVTQTATLDNPFPGGLLAITGNSLGELTGPGNTTSYYVNTVPRQYSDEASLHVQQQVRQYLFEVGGSLNVTHGLGVDYDDNLPSVAAWKAAYGPQFDSTGRPVDTLPANTQVPNPFLGNPYINNSNATNKTVTAYQLLKPNPISNMTRHDYTGTSTYYSLQARAERRYNNGFGVQSAFTWSKTMSTTSLFLNQVISQKLQRQLSSADQRFLVTVAPTYVLPLGKDGLLLKHVNHLVDSVIGGWQLSGIFTFQSGTPVNLPTNSAFFQGGDPKAPRKSKTQWFDTTKFAAFPGKTIPAAQVAAYPSWTGISSMPGFNWTPTSSSDATKNGVYNDFNTWVSNYPTYYGDVRNPYYVNVDMGLRKSIPIHNAIRVQLRIDAFNALNHPLNPGPNTTASNAYFGVLNGTSTPSQTNPPRQFQLEGKLYF